jgi:hypothetical protein
MGDLDYRTLRLFDLGRSEMIEVACTCGWTTHNGPGFLQRRYRLPSDMLIYAAIPGPVFALQPARRLRDPGHQ